MLGRAHHDGEQAVLQRVAAEDVGDLAGDHRLDAVIEQCPRRVLTRRAAAEVVAGDENRAAARVGLVQWEGGIVAAIGGVAPVFEAMLAQAGAFGRGKETRRDDPVGVDVLVAQHRGAGMHVGERAAGLAHAATSWVMYSRGSATQPATAEAAATSGLASTVRAPLPWRPSKLRLLVATTSWPGWARSPFMAMHIEHPGSRHSAPAARKISCRPSRSASRRTCSEPGTTSTRTPAATRRPLRMPAAARRSDKRPLVQLPMNTTSTTSPAMGLPATTCM